MAAQDGHLGVVRYLLRAAANPNVASTEGRGTTPLILASSQGRQAVVQALIEAGANVNAQDAEGQTCLHYAVSCENLDVCKYLSQVKSLNRTLKDNENARAIDLTNKKEFIKKSNKKFKSSERRSWW
jgi:ankyrin repeat protein